MTTSTVLEAWQMQVGKLQGQANYDQGRADEELAYAKKHLALAREYHQLSIQSAQRAGMVIKENTTALRQVLADGWVYQKNQEKNK